MDKEPGKRSFELWDEKVWRGRGERFLWHDLDGETKTFWAGLETAIEAPLLVEIDRLKANVVELGAHRGSLLKICADAMHVGKLCEKHREAWIKELDEREKTADAGEVGTYCDGCIWDKHNSIAARLGEAIELVGEMMPYVDEYFKKKWGFLDAFGALCAYHASLTQEKAP